MWGKGMQSEGRGRKCGEKEMKSGEEKRDE